MIKNERGISLVEVLTVLALLSIVLLLASSLHLFGQKQYVSQTDELHIQANERLAVNMLIKEIRKADTVEVDAIQQILIINGTDQYMLDGTELKKGSQIVGTDISEFKVEMSGNQIRLKVGSMPETTIYVRE
ncbi:prepilin-type N-terminal cleavage/methylation domain-containing protein [Bacillus sp. B15-48]|uniref:prepilin-type N-terminal cleavage/methylation domain-containing protein n=1 Tax=Bacillus sp. B15-48 TaxID=1548601 RepID=UPI00193F2D0A|nr:prepilin-type N-terminal cleavage/methylation domain-containing protein [Bacillus sp. B15-48]